VLENIPGTGVYSGGPSNNKHKGGQSNVGLIEIQILPQFQLNIVSYIYQNVGYQNQNKTRIPEDKV
jgi:hypothetical protein